MIRQKLLLLKVLQYRPQDCSNVDQKFVNSLNASPSSLSHTSVVMLNVVIVIVVAPFDCIVISVAPLPGTRAQLTSNSRRVKPIDI
jgi:hypothetical protein